MKRTPMLFLFGVGLLLLMLVIGIYIVPHTQVGGPNTTRQSDASKVPISDVYVDITYVTPGFVKRLKLEPYLAQWQTRGQPFLIGINTHVGTIANLDLRGKVLLEDNHGDRFPALGSPVVLSEHHNMYLLLFPLRDQHGEPIFAPTRDHFRLVLLNVGKTPERIFEWRLPLMEAEHARTLANTLMLVLSVVGALMVILSPCAIELTTYYTGIIAGIVSSAVVSEQSKKLPGALRHRIYYNLGAFVFGFTTLYILSGATVSLMGSKLVNMNLQQMSKTEDPLCTVTEASVLGGHMNHQSLFGSWTLYANWIGATFLVYFALRTLGFPKRGGTCFLWMARIGQKLRMGIAALVELISPRRAIIIRAPCLSLQDSSQITPINSYCAGLGLSVSCLTCMGGAILYPLLIFIGTSSWYWGALILGTYSLSLSVPMAIIAVAVGDFSWKYIHRPWLNKSLQWTSATIMIFVALLIAFDRTRFINTIFFTVLSGFKGFI